LALRSHHFGRLLSTWLALSGAACDFNPLARPPKPERLSEDNVQVLSTLDARGEYALLAYEGAEGEARVAISRWQKGERCDVPVIGEPIAAPLPRARTAKKEPALYVPVATTGADGDRELVLVDERCAAYGPFGSIKPTTARTVIRDSDEGGHLLYRDAQNRLFVLDPARDLTPHLLAEQVVALRATHEARGKQRDAVWIIADGALSLLTLEGEVLATVGTDVHAFTLSRDRERIAFVDGDDLYEGVVPDFTPHLLARDGCGPYYGRDTLEFFAPCEEPMLRRVQLANGVYQEFEPGVFASSRQEGVQLDYKKLDDETVLSATFPDREPITVTPTFDSGHVYVLDGERIAGLAPEGRFGVWSRVDREFTPLLEDVAEVIPHHRGKRHSFSWVVYHDVEESLGSLSLVDQDGAISEIARRVPLPAQQGFVIEDGSALADYPFAAPLAVLLEEAYPMAESSEAGEDAQRFCGRLKALSVTGTPRADLAEHVCSYVIVAAPIPGVLYGVESGADQGLWFVAL
jgi:hypothetical protein